MGLNMNNKYNNTVILSKGGEHGKRVIQWWKEQGVDVMGYEGVDEGWYYGLVGKRFGTFYECPFSAKIIELPEDNPQSLIGRKVRGFKFEGDTDEVRKYVGKVGVIKEYYLDNSYLVDFGDNEWYYPESLIHEHLVKEDNIISTTPQKLFNYLSEELGVTALASQIHDIERIVLKMQPSPQIIDLSNVEGVEMMVSDYDTWVIRFVVAKVNCRYIDCNGISWKLAKPIEVKKVTMQNIEKMFGGRVEIVKEVSNEQ